MRNFLIVLGITSVALGAGFLYYYMQFNQPSKLINLDVPTMKLSSTAFEHAGKIPLQYTCDGENMSPDLMFSELPDDTQSLVLVAEDPDAPLGTWLHWSLWNINPKTPVIAEDSVPEEAVQGTTSFNDIGYGGPCPPTGEHRYIFKGYALDKKLTLGTGASRSDLESAMEGHIIAKAELMGLYKR